MMLPRGARIQERLVDELRREYRLRGFQQVITPQIYSASLWKRSGHWDHYRDDMFEVIACRHGVEPALRESSDTEFAASIDAAQPHVSGDADSARMFLKPMNCPAHCVMFARKTHSYRELPVRYADFGALHRNELVS